MTCSVNSGAGIVSSLNRKTHKERPGAGASLELIVQVLKSVLVKSWVDLGRLHGSKKLYKLQE